MSVWIIYNLVLSPAHIDFYILILLSLIKYKSRVLLYINLNFIVTVAFIVCRSFDTNPYLPISFVVYTMILTHHPTSDLVNVVIWFYYFSILASEF